jgi:hypothetical protein
MTVEQFTGALTEAMVTQNDKRDTGGDVAKWWAAIAAAIKQEDLMPGEDYKIDGDHLYIRFGDCFEQYSIYIQKMTRSPGMVAATMRTKLEKSTAFIELVKGTKFNGINTSAYKFSLTAIGAEFTESVIMKRTNKFARRGGGAPPPPNDAAGTNGSSHGPKPVAGGPSVPVMVGGDDEDEMLF